MPQRRAELLISNQRTSRLDLNKRIRLADMDAIFYSAGDAI